MYVLCEDDTLTEIDEDTFVPVQSMRKKDIERKEGDYDNGDNDDDDYSDSDSDNDV